MGWECPELASVSVRCEHSEMHPPFEVQSPACGSRARIAAWFRTEDMQERDFRPRTAIDEMSDPTRPTAKPCPPIRSFHADRADLGESGDAHALAGPWRPTRLADEFRCSRQARPFRGPKGPGLGSPSRARASREHRRRQVPQSEAAGLRPHGAPVILQDHLVDGVCSGSPRTGAEARPLRVVNNAIWYLAGHQSPGATGMRLAPCSPRGSETARRAAG